MGLIYMSEGSAGRLRELLGSWVMADTKYANGSMYRYVCVAEEYKMARRPKPKLTKADELYTEWKDLVRGAFHHIRVEQRNAFIVINGMDEIHLYMQLSRDITDAHLLALGLRWSLENEEWRKKIARKAREKLIKCVKKKALS